MQQAEIIVIQKSLCNQDDTFWRIFQALGDCARYRMVKILMRYRRIPVSELAHICNISVPAASQHLRVLHNAGLIRKERSGQSIFYELIEEKSHIKKIMEIVEHHLKEEEAYA